MENLLELAGNLGGIGGVLAVVILFMYRADRKSTEHRQSVWLEQDQKTREENTEALTRLITLLERMNGRS